MACASITPIECLLYLRQRNSFDVQLFFRSLTSTFLRELKVLVHQLLGSDIHEDLLALITYLSLTRCRKVRVYEVDDDLSLYLLETLVAGNEDLVLLVTSLILL